MIRNDDYIPVPVVKSTTLTSKPSWHLCWAFTQVLGGGMPSVRNKTELDTACCSNPALQNLRYDYISLYVLQVKYFIWLQNLI